MAEKGWEVALGGVVLAVAVGFAVFAAQGAGTVFGRTPGYPLVAEFRSADGVRVGTEVRLAGVKVGQVTRMDLDPETFQAVVEIRVDERLALPSDSTLAVATEGLLGGTFLEILPGGMPDTLAPGDRFSDTQSAIALIPLLLRAFTGTDVSAADPMSSSDAN